MNNETNPYQAPQSKVENIAPNQDIQYVGFWARVAAGIIDSIAIMVVTLPLMYLAYGGGVFTDFSDSSMVKGPMDVIINWILPIVAVILFWTYKQATPGKMIFGAKIVDAKTGEKPSLGQWVIRYIGYFPASIVFFLGLMWVGWDKRKQGWHDKMAGTVVVYDNG